MPIYLAAHTVPPFLIISRTEFGLLVYAFDFFRNIVTKIELLGTLWYANNNSSEQQFLNFCKTFVPHYSLLVSEVPTIVSWREHLRSPFIANRFNLLESVIAPQLVSISRNNTFKFVLLIVCFSFLLQSLCSCCIRVRSFFVHPTYSYVLVMPIHTPYAAFSYTTVRCLYFLFLVLSIADKKRLIKRSVLHFNKNNNNLNIARPQKTNYHHCYA